MPVLDEFSELRELQARAYGRGGSLTAADAERLRELEGRRALADTGSAVVERDETPALVLHGAPRDETPDAPALVVERAERDEPPAAPLVVERAERDETPEPVGSGLQPPKIDQDLRARGIRRVLLLGAAVALLAVGIGVGWLLFGLGILPAGVPSSQRDELAMIEEDGAFDPGSVRFLGEKHGVGVWQATREGATQECVVLTHEKSQRSGCQAVTEDPEEPTMPGMSASIDFQDDGESMMIWATIVRDISGRETAIVQRQSMSEDDWRQQYTPEEIEIVERLESAGFEPWGLYAVGYDGDLPVWQGMRDGENCLAVVVDTEVHAGCAETGALDETIRLRLGVTDYELRQSPDRGPSFSIIRHVAAEQTVEPGEQVNVGGEQDDPGEVAPDDPQD